MFPSVHFTAALFRCLFLGPPQPHVVCVLRPVRRLRLRRPAPDERASQAEPAEAVGAVVSLSGRLQVSRRRRIFTNTRRLKPSLLCSIAGALRTGFYMLHMIRTAGFRDSVCDNVFYSAPITKLWAYAFVLSKAPELGEAPALLPLPRSLSESPGVVPKAAVKMLPNRICWQGRRVQRCSPAQGRNAFVFRPAGPSPSKTRRSRKPWKSVAVTRRFILKAEPVQGLICTERFGLD